MGKTDHTKQALSPFEATNLDELSHRNDNVENRLHYYHVKKEADPLVGYYFDKVSILSYTEPQHLYTILPIKELKAESYSCDIVRVSEKAKEETYYKSIITLVAPSRRCLELLLGYFHNPKSYKITSLEIAEDTHWGSKQLAIDKAYDLMLITRKKWAQNNYIYDNMMVPSEKYHKSKEGILSEQTGYFGQENFRCVIYARLSKINNNPCAHNEWRINDANMINKKTKIKTINDLLAFDFEAFFEKKYKTYLNHSQISHYKIGIWFYGWGRRKKLTKRQIMSVGLAGTTLCCVNEIHTYAALVKYFMEKKIRIKKLKRPLNNWEKKIMSIKDYKMFAIDEPLSQ